MSDFAQVGKRSRLRTRLITAVGLGGILATMLLAVESNPGCLRGALAATPFGNADCGVADLVQPGAEAQPLPPSPQTEPCMLNFLFKGSDKYYYVGTAGHCLNPQDGEKVWKSYKGAPVQIGGTKIGNAAYALVKGYRKTPAGDPDLQPASRISQDFGLIRLAKGVKISAQMCHFGGPTGIDTSRLSTRVMLESFTSRGVLSTALPARTMTADNTLDPNVVTAQGYVERFAAGTPVTRDGKALGLIATYGLSRDASGAAGNVYVTRLSPQLARAAKVLKIKLTLLTAARL